MKAKHSSVSCPERQRTQTADAATDRPLNMSGSPPSSLQQTTKRCLSPMGGGSGVSDGGCGGKQFYSESSGRACGGGRVKLYLHAVTDPQAASLVNTDNNQPLQEIIRKTGADVQLDSNPSPVPGMKIVIIKGLTGKIEMAVRLITLKTGAQGNISEQAQTFWLQWVEAAFPDLDSRAYFLPPVYVNRVPMTRESVGDQDVLVLESARGQADQSKKSELSPSTVTLPSPPPVYESDVREDAAMQRVLFCLKEISEQNGEFMVGMSQLQFGEYLGEPCYAAAAAQLPLSKTLPNSSSRDRQGDFDVLIIHKIYGFVVCEVKSLGGKINQFTASDEEIHNNIRKKLLEAVAQLDKAEAMLSHLVSDIAPGLRITKTIAFPNLTARQIQQAIADHQHLSQTLCRCLGTTDPADMTGLCLCSDQLSDPKTPWDVSSHVLRELGHWWQRLVAGAGPDSHMTCKVYKTLVARFCGPATTVGVPCIFSPRVSVKTLGQAVWCTGECYTAVITLFPEQLHLLNTAPPTLFVTGPPGTGKTVVLLLMAIEWLRCGHHVYIVSFGTLSRAVSSMLYHLLLQTVNTKLIHGQVHLLPYHFFDDDDINDDINDDEDDDVDAYKGNVEKAVEDLSQKARGGSLHVIADEAGPERAFKTFCEKLLTKVPNLHLWAASFYHKHIPVDWQVEYLTRPLRSPPAVVREIKKDKKITEWSNIRPYSDRGVPDHTDGPPVRRLLHQYHCQTEDQSRDCVTCGRELASLLYSLRVGVPVNTTTQGFSIPGSTTPLSLQWRDVLLLYDCHGVSDTSGMVKALREAGIPVRVMKDDDIEDVATARSDVVWVASRYRVYGLERKVVVCLENNGDRVHSMSRCTSQLVIVEE